MPQHKKFLFFLRMDSQIGYFSELEFNAVSSDSNGFFGGWRMLGLTQDLTFNFFTN
jgi:hypothetical protein